MPTIDKADDQQATCKIAKDPLSPLVVEWPGTAKTDLESTSKRGVVVVSYAGCTLKILSGCGAPGTYDYQPTTPARDRLQMSNQNELYARLPLGAASLKGELSTGTGTSLELDYIAVGQRVAKAPASLAGECTGATHYVRTITVGAFSLDARVAGATPRNLRAQGRVEQCASDPTSPECAAILQLGLMPIALGRAYQLGNRNLTGCAAQACGARIGPVLMAWATRRGHAYPEDDHGIWSVRTAQGPSAYVNHRAGEETLHVVVHVPPDTWVVSGQERRLLDAIGYPELLDDLIRLCGQ